MVAALNELFTNALQAFKRFTDAAAAQELRFNPELQSSLLAPDYLSKLPKIVAAKFSPISYFLNGDYQFPVDLLYSFSLNPELYIPPIPCEWHSQSQVDRF